MLYWDLYKWSDQDEAVTSHERFLKEANRGSHQIQRDPDVHQCDSFAPPTSLWCSAFCFLLLFFLQRSLRMTAVVFLPWVCDVNPVTQKKSLILQQHIVLAVRACVHACVINPASWCFQLSMDHNEELIWIAVIHKPALVHVAYVGGRVWGWGGKKKQKTSYLLFARVLY